MVNVHESDHEQYNAYSFHFGLLFFRFLQIEQTDLDQFVGHVGERLAFLQGAFWEAADIPTSLSDVKSEITSDVRSTIGLELSAGWDKFRGGH